MSGGRGNAGTESYGHELRVSSVTVGAILTVVSAMLIGAYCLFTWDRPHRTLMIASVASAVVLPALLPFLPIERIVRSRWREAFFLTWSGAIVAVVTLAVALDGTDESPLALTYVLPLIFAASSYPLASTVAVCVAVVAASLGVGLSDGGDDESRAFVLTGLLTAAAFMCALQARNQDRQRAALARMSRTDPLTGVLNRRGFEERLAASLQTAARAGEPLALLLLDLDGFKPVNDRDGHAAGDKLLRWTAHRIGACVRPDDVVGRIGGDEFAVVVPGVDAEAGGELARRIAGVLEERIGASIGVAAYPLDGATDEDLHRCADERLYVAKRARPARPEPAPPAAGAIVVPAPAST